VSEAIELQMESRFHIKVGDTIEIDTETTIAIEVESGTN